VTTMTSERRATDVELVGIRKEFGSFVAVHSLDLLVSGSQFVAILGPSGCGKTTVLRMISGLLDPTAGAIHVGGRNMVQVPAHKRNIGFVFQDYALFPHMTVAKNVAFGLEMRRASAAATKVRVAECLELVGLAAHAEKRPAALSGGERQRVALARALAIRPEVMLLDEPLSNLDARLRASLRGELRRIHDETGITTIFVTHDQAEALSIADRIVVMSQGRVHQDGDPKAVYERPATRFVANFLGEANVFPGTPAGSDGVATELGVVKTSVPVTAEHDAVMVRPEHVDVRGADEAAASDARVGSIASVAYLGSTTRYGVVLDSGHSIASDVRNELSPQLSKGDRVTVSWRSEYCVPLSQPPSDDNSN
jgi:putative spermidine/putrescine transport system ATP-binding protein